VKRPSHISCSDQGETPARTKTFSKPSHSQHGDVRLYIIKDSKYEVDKMLGTALPRCEYVLFI
jgi:hypothetical protein